MQRGFKQRASWSLDGIYKYQKTRTLTLTLKELQTVFRLFDKDQDGFISLQEVNQCTRSLGHQTSDTELQHMFKEVDQDGNGLIDFDEFVRMMETRVKKQPENTEMRALFAAFDKDKSGFIDAEELKTTLNDVGMQVSDEDVALMLKEAGVKIDGRIFYEDFVKMMSGHIGQEQRQCSLLTEPGIDLSDSGEEFQEDINELKMAFAMFDKNGDGVITSREVVEVMRSLGVNVDLKEVKQMVRRVDRDGNGVIDFEEFSSWMLKHKSLLGGLKPLPHQADEAEMKQLFKVFDKDGDGKVSAQEVQMTMKDLGMSLTSEDVAAMMRQAGVGPHGNIYYQDFCHMMSEQLKAVQSPRFTSEQMRELQATFDMFDKDKDGEISIDEVRQVVKAIGEKPNNESIEAMFRQIDLDGNGLISFDEFVLLVEKQVHRQSDDVEIRAMFDAFDKDKNGYIEPHELKVTFRDLGVPLSDSDVVEMLHEAGIQGQLIYFEDFAKIMSGTIGKAQKTVSKQVSPIGTKMKPPVLPTLEETETPPRSPYQQRSEVSRTHAAVMNGDTVKMIDDHEVKEERSECSPKTRDLKSAFTNQDRDEDGYISSGELVRVLTNLGFKHGSQAVRRMVEIVDKEGRGRINFAQFSHLIRRKGSTWVKWQKYKTAEEQDMKVAFKKFDKSGSGHVKPEDLRLNLTDLGLPLTDLHFNEMITDAQCELPGRIYYDEFCKIVFGSALQPILKIDQLSAEDKRKLKVVYHLYDSDNDGLVCTQELHCIMRVVGIHPLHHIGKQLLQACDYDGNGILESNEFMQIVTKGGQNVIKTSQATTCRKKYETPVKKTPTKSMAPQHWKAFKVFDKNRDGYITAKEIRMTMRDLGIPVSNKEVLKILATADQNADGKIDYREFSAMLQDSPDLLAEVCQQREKKERTMYEYLYGMELTEADLHAAFNAFDHDGKGKIEASDVAVVMRSIGISFNSSELAKMISHASNGNGKVEFNEFLKMMSRSRTKHTTEEGRKQSEEDEMRQAFKVFDIDGNGVIDAMELKMTMRNLGENLSDADVRAMIRTADKNGDGKIDYEEFIKMMYNK